MECSLDNKGKPSFKLLEPVTVVYKDENLQAKVETGGSFAKWVRSTGDLAVKWNK
jgi:hypothetical protein